ncbi:MULTISPECIES: hypothetical protein [unclassified Streptomyces]|uniref:hypothetical protein n=1 Tax=unclassified Streptomyces TaxID=2593676 RepID=UPI0033A81C30
MEPRSENEMYRVRAILMRQGWRLNVPHVGEVVVRRLTQATSAARNLIAEKTEADPDSVHVQLDTDLGEPLQSAKREAVEAALTARRAQERSSQAHKNLVKSLQNSGISGADISLILGVSRQRVSQLAAEA